MRWPTTVLSGTPVINDMRVELSGFVASLKGPVMRPQEMLDYVIVVGGGLIGNKYFCKS